MAYTAIDNPELYFQVKTYTGDGASTHAITLDGDEDMSPNLVWIKERSGNENHSIFDTVRTATKIMYPNLTNAEGTGTTTLKSFDSDGFSVGTDPGQNTSSDTYVAWCWKESATAGFDINIHTGSGSSADISHNLSAVPEMIFTKRRNDTQEWFVYTSTTGSQKAVFLDATSAVGTQASAYDAAPTSSVINYGGDNGVNGSSDTYVAYLWRSVQGFSSMGSYIGNGNADGPFIYTGFRPAWVMFKKSSSTSSWWIGDSKRDVDNVVQQELYADTNSAENTESDGRVDFLSNGFKHRNSGGSGNTSGATYIYMAFAEAPFVNSNGVPCNAR